LYTCRRRTPDILHALGGVWVRGCVYSQYSTQLEFLFMDLVVGPCQILRTRTIFYRKKFALYKINQFKMTLCQHLQILEKTSEMVGPKFKSIEEKFQQQNRTVSGVAIMLEVSCKIL
jgi:hypothetical protein